MTLRRKVSKVVLAEVARFSAGGISAAVDLNTADEKYLVAALVASGMSEPQARARAARVRDWTDADDERRANGADRRDYLPAAILMRAHARSPTTSPAAKS